MKMKSRSDKPLVSMIVIAYNQGKYIGEAVESALAQTYSPLEIVLSDDCSVDSTYKTMVEAAGNYRGPHKVILNRNAVNVGAAENINKGWSLTSGDLVVLQAGDDISIPHRTERLVERWIECGKTSDLICSQFDAIDEHSQLTGFRKCDPMFLPDQTLPTRMWRCGAAGSTAAYSRKLYNKYGPLNRNVIAEDWVFPFWAWVESRLEVVPEPLVHHRVHGGGISVQARRISRIGERSKRYALRKRIALSSVAVAQHWLDAWRIGRWRDDIETAGRLERLVLIRKAQHDVFGASLVDVIRSAERLGALGCWGNAFGVLVRHGARIY